jgi:hypothetical protein
LKCPNYPSESDGGGGDWIFYDEWTGTATDRSFI